MPRTDVHLATPHLLLREHLRLGDEPRASDLRRDRCHQGESGAHLPQLDTGESGLLTTHKTTNALVCLSVSLSVRNY